MSASARDVIKLIHVWRPRACKTEKDLERSLHKHLQKNLEESDIIPQYASGRVKGDICVDGDVLIELKDTLESTAQLQRLLGQLELYNIQWKGKVIVVVCGDSQRDLVKTLRAKVESLKPQFSFSDQKIFLVVRGSLRPKEQSGISFW